MAKAFDDETNERLRAIAKRVLDTRFGGTQYKLADALGVSASFVSEIVNSGRGFGLETLIALARFAPLEILDILRIDPATVGALLTGAADEKGTGIELLPDAIRRAARACIELTGSAPADVCAAALDVHARFGDLPNTTPDWWLAQIRDSLRAPGVQPDPPASSPGRAKRRAKTA